MAVLDQAGAERRLRLRIGVVGERDIAPEQGLLETRLAPSTDHRGRCGAARGAARAPGADHDPAHQALLERALGHQRRLQPGRERPELGGVLAVEEQEPAGAQAVLEGVARRARLAGDGARPARSGAVCRLARARLLSLVMHGLS